MFTALDSSCSVQSSSQLRTLRSCACLAGAAEHSEVKQRIEMMEQIIESLKPKIENDNVFR